MILNDREHLNLEAGKLVKSLNLLQPKLSFYQLAILRSMENVSMLKSIDSIMEKLKKSVCFYKV